MVLKIKQCCNTFPGGCIGKAQRCCTTQLQLPGTYAKDKTLWEEMKDLCNTSHKHQCTLSHFWLPGTRTHACTSSAESTPQCNLLEEAAFVDETSRLCGWD